MQTLNIYMVYTKNNFNQILVFETWESAFNWCKAATTWSDEKIKENIKQPWKSGNAKYFHISQ